MLSILIPVYNYDVYALVSELKHQADELGIKYEILAQDDNSQKFTADNEFIFSFSAVNFWLLSSCANISYFIPNSSA